MAEGSNRGVRQAGEAHGPPTCAGRPVSGGELHEIQVASLNELLELFLAIPAFLFGHASITERGEIACTWGRSGGSLSMELVGSCVG